MAKSLQSSENRLEKILAYMVAGVVGVSIICLLIMIVSVASGAKTVPPIVMQIPGIGFPLGFLLIIALLTASLIRRKRESK